jgi:hypothetical protein
MPVAVPIRKLIQPSLALLAVAAVVGSAPAQEAAKATTAWELSPYRIKVVVAAQTGGELSRHAEQDLAADLAARAASTVGGSWRLEASPAPPELRQRMLNSLGNIAGGDLPAAALQGDKALLIAVRSSGGGFEVEARELDVVTGLWNSKVALHCAQAEALPSAAFQALLRAFAPLARIESSDGKSATLRLRAGALARRDKDLPALAAGVAFRPVLIKADAQGAAERGSAEVVPWTYLAPTGVTGSLVTCRVQTGLAGSPIPDYHPLRQRWAVGVAPSSDSTTLRLVTKGDPPAPLEGYEALEENESTTFTPIGRSNREGLLTVPPGSQAVRMLVLRRGEAALARLPIVPGLAAELTIPLSASGQSLALESSLAELEDALVDLAAKREVLAARLRAAIKSRDTSGGQALLTQLRSPAAADALAARLDQAQQAIAAADESAQARLRGRLDALKALLDKHRAESPADKLEADLKAAGP